MSVPSRALLLLRLQQHPTFLGGEGAQDPPCSSGRPDGEKPLDSWLPPGCRTQPHRGQSPTERKSGGREGLGKIYSPPQRKMLFGGRTRELVATLPGLTQLQPYSPPLRNSRELLKRKSLSQTSPPQYRVLPVRPSVASRGSLLGWLGREGSARWVLCCKQAGRNVH